DLDEDVYMHVPQGVPCSKPNQVCKLLKSLHGLRQASRMWYEKLTSLFLKLGYTQSNADYLSFILKRDRNTLQFLLV
nr:retrotransposon peptide {Ty1-copia retrotransposon element, clone Sat 107} [Vicia sativa, leaves, Peptide Transposon Partial, 76 aa] [Vicia sativa]